MPLPGRCRQSLSRRKSKAQQARRAKQIFYLQRLRARKEEGRTDLVDRLLHMVTGQ